MEGQSWGRGTIALHKRAQDCTLQLHNAQVSQKVKCWSLKLFLLHLFLPGPISVRVVPPIAMMSDYRLDHHHGEHAAVVAIVLLGNVELVAVVDWERFFFAEIDLVQFSVSDIMISHYSS